MQVIKIKLLSNIIFSLEGQKSQNCTSNLAFRVYLTKKSFNYKNEGNFSNTTVLNMFSAEPYKNVGNLYTFGLERKLRKLTTD